MRSFKYMACSQLRYWFAAYLAAVVTSYLVASLFQSLLVLFALEQAGAEIPLDIWVDTVFHDVGQLAFGGKYVSFGLSLIVGFAVALPAAVLVERLSGLPGILIYPSACATAIATQIYTINANFFDLTLFAGTRGLLGFIFQLLAGFIGGYCFFLIKRKGAHKERKC